LALAWEGKAVAVNTVACPSMVHRSVLLVVALVCTAFSGDAARVKKSRSAVTSEIGSCSAGVGFSLNFQRHPLDLNVAARKLKDLGVRCVRMWHYRSDYLQALLNVGIKDVLVNVPTGELGSLAHSSSHANNIAQILAPFYNKGMRFRVAVGNEPLASWEGGNSNGPLLLPSLENMQNALDRYGLRSVTCTVAFYNGVMGVGYPPQNGAFQPGLTSTIRDVADFLVRTGGEFTIHIYPFFAVVYDPQNVPVDLALGKVKNTIDGVTYNGLLHQQIVATRAALNRLGSKYSRLPLNIGECGWPSAGHYAATVANARDFTNYVIDNANSMDQYLRTIYLFEAFDEQKKSGTGHGGGGAATEDNFGIMRENGDLKYSVSFYWK